VHLSHRGALKELKGIKRISYQLSPAPVAAHPFTQKFTDTVHHGQIVMEKAMALKKNGFIPDIIYGYAGWGPTLFMKDIFPDTPFIGYFEWFLNAFGSEYNFDPNAPMDFAHQLYLRVFNSSMLLDLYSCDGGISPTFWQRQQFPQALQKKIAVVHDGVDCDFYQPASNAALKIERVKLDLTGVTEIVTYVTRGMEPFRGFPQVMRAIAVLQQRRPNLHAVIVGTEEFFYSKPPTVGNSYKAVLLEELQGQLDLQRLHFTGWLQPDEYRQLLQASTVHFYLSYPYVLSWSLMEAMACGCLVIGSRGNPVEEVISDGENGLLVDFFAHEQLAQRAIEVLEAAPYWRERIKENARQTILDRYALFRTLPQQAALLDEFYRKCKVYKPG
jgi:glycosyltransferase involved in cell wall biosynthesis